MEDIEIVNKILSGDKQAYSLIVRKYEKIAYKYIFSKTGNKQDTDDIVQELFLKLYMKLEKYNPNYKFYTWFYLNMYSGYCDYCRKHIKESFISLEQEDNNLLDFIDTYFEDVEEEYIKKEELDYLRKCINKLSETESKLLTLRYIENLAYEEVVEIMNMDYYTVKQMTYTGRNKLHNLLKRKEYPIREIKYDKETRHKRYVLSKQKK